MGSFLGRKTLLLRSGQAKGSRVRKGTGVGEGTLCCRPGESPAEQACRLSDICGNCTGCEGGLLVDRSQSRQHVRSLHSRGCTEAEWTADRLLLAVCLGAAANPSVPQFPQPQSGDNVCLRLMLASLQMTSGPCSHRTFPQQTHLLHPSPQGTQPRQRWSLESGQKTNPISELLLTSYSHL